MKKSKILLSTIGLILITADASAVSLPSALFDESISAKKMRDELKACVTPGAICDLPVINSSNKINLTLNDVNPASGAGYELSLNNQKLAVADELDIQFSLPSEISMSQDCTSVLNSLTSDYDVFLPVGTGTCDGGRVGGTNIVSSTLISQPIPTYTKMYREMGKVCFAAYRVNSADQFSRYYCFNINMNLDFNVNNRNIVFTNPKNTISTNTDIIEYDFIIADEISIDPSKIRYSNDVRYIYNRLNERYNDFGNYGWRGFTTMNPRTGQRDFGLTFDAYLEVTPSFKTVVTGKAVTTKKAAARMELSCGTTPNEVARFASDNQLLPNVRSTIALSRIIVGNNYEQNTKLSALKQNCPSGAKLNIRDVVPVDMGGQTASLAIRYGTFTDETQYWQDYGSLIIKDLSASFSIWDRLDFINRDVTTSHAQVLKYMRDYSVLVKAELDLYYAAKGLDPALGLSFFYDATKGELSGILIPIVDLAAAPADWAAFHQSLNTGGVNENVNYVFNIEMLTNLEQVRLNGAPATLPNLVQSARTKLDNEVTRSLYFIALTEHAAQATQDNLCKLRTDLKADLAKTPNAPATNAAATCKTPVVLAQQNQQNNIKVKSTVSYSKVTTSVIK